MNAVAELTCSLSIPKVNWSCEQGFARVSKAIGRVKLSGNIVCTTFWKWHLLWLIQPSDASSVKGKTVVIVE